MMTNRRDFIRITGTSILSMSMFPSTINPLGNFELPFTNFIRKSPESQGIASSSIVDFIKAAQASGINWHSFMLLRHGYVIAEGWWWPFEAKYKHTLYSVSKSFTSTAIGLLVKDGKLSVEDTVISFFPDELPAQMSDHLKQMKVKHLLTMTTGHPEDTFPAMLKSTAPWTQSFLSQKVVYDPGTYFLYNTGASYMLSAIVNKVGGQDLVMFLEQRLFKPLGISDFDWAQSPQGLSLGGIGLRLNTEGIAKLGQLYLQKGQWNNQEILTAQWVEEATRYQTSSNTGNTDWNQGYGYQFWRCKPGFYRADGAYGQFCIVMPPYDAVLAITSESWDMQKQMDIFWEKIVPALHTSGRPENPAMQITTLPENPGDEKLLKAELSRLSLPVPKGAVHSNLANKYDGAKIKMKENEFGATEMQLKLSGDVCTWTSWTDRGEQTLHLGWERWQVSAEGMYYPFIPQNAVLSKIAATAMWIDDNTLQFNIRFVEGIHADKITFVFDDDKVVVSFLNSLSEHTENIPEWRQKVEGYIRH